MGIISCYWIEIPVPWLIPSIPWPPAKTFHCSKSFIVLTLQRYKQFLNPANFFEVSTWLCKCHAKPRTTKIMPCLQSRRCDEDYTLGLIPTWKGLTANQYNIFILWLMMYSYPCSSFLNTKIQHFSDIRKFFLIKKWA